jgi:hypothetical protein
MKEKTELRTIELVRHIRDEQAELLANKSSEEIIEFFHQAGAAARAKAHPIVRAAQVANHGLQADVPQAPRR